MQLTSACQLSQLSVKRTSGRQAYCMLTWRTSVYTQRQHAWCKPSWQCCAFDHAPGCRRANVGGMVVSPITGELVPVEQMAEHMRISLIDPRSARSQAAIIRILCRETRERMKDLPCKLLSSAAGTGAPFQ